jgi:hypothetical protein
MGPLERAYHTVFGDRERDTYSVGSLRKSYTVFGDGGRETPTLLGPLESDPVIRKWFDVFIVLFVQ